MLRWQDKELHELTFEETVEFEKSTLKKILAANTAGMSSQVIDQLNGFLHTIRMHKSEALQEFISEATGKKIEDGSLLIGEEDTVEEEQESSDDTK
jgi:hypothetical protein